ncbi:MAG: type I glyceraldehyde-3-phosphate dehydrogenase [Alphaproteobacteria bacterium]|nr:type I glyceraldehyde-3-phosphate dehydrogenase [Alphaproteobacteria bacterium]
MRLAINGLGRIGRAIVRGLHRHDDLELVQVNDLTSPEVLAHLLVHDTVQGRWDVPVAVEGEALRIGDRLVPVSQERDPARLPWGERGVDLVLECTGRFKSRADAEAHLRAGAGRVLISAPGKGVDATFVYGVNHQDFDPARHRIVSNASCTTNCLAPVAKVVHATAGIEHGTMTTVHAYTMDQNLLDGAHHKDLRRARAAALNIVPTSTGAASAIGLVIPALDGRLQGIAVRVPVACGSLVDLVVRTERPTDVATIHAALQAAAAGELRGVLETSSAPLVSSDIVGTPTSSIVDLEQTTVIDGRLLRVIAWYDNEWGFSMRMIDLARHLGGLS